MASLENRRVLVTGAAGFIGGHLTAALVRRGANVRAMVRYTSRADPGTLQWFGDGLLDEVEIELGDLRDIESVERAVRDVDVVFHLGAQVAIPYSYRNPRDFVETNVGGTLNIAQASLRAGVERVVHTSTSEVYGTAQTIPITEAHPLHAQSPYAASKIAADKLIESFFLSYSLPAVTLRPFNTYGPHQSRRAIVPTVITQALAGDVLRLGALTPRRDLTFVDDTVDAFIRAGETLGIDGETIQLGTGNDVSIKEVVEAVGDVLDRELEVQLDEQRLRPAGSEVERLISDPAKAERLMGWRPAVDLREGLAQTIEWFEGRLASERVAEYAV